MGVSGPLGDEQPGGDLVAAAKHLPAGLAGCQAGPSSAGPWEVGKQATLAATGGGPGNPVTFTHGPASGTGVCTVTANTVSYTAAGSFVIDTNQAGIANNIATQQIAIKH